jgi:DNA repair protein RAD16
MLAHQAASPGLNLRGIIHGSQVVIYHGGKRTSDPAELAAADVVLTTYSIVESEFRKNCLPGKVACRYCNTKMYPDRLRLHLKCALLTV